MSGGAAASDVSKQIKPIYIYTYIYILQVTSVFEYLLSQDLPPICDVNPDKFNYSYCI